MTFNEYLSDIKALLEAKYPTIDFENDWGVANKLNDLVWIISKRIEDPIPTKEKREQDQDFDMSC